MKKYRISIISAAVLILVVAATIFAVGDQDSSGLRQIKSYDPDGICQSITDPECGNCPGTITNDTCYVEQGTFEQYD
jgi:hypothetical protein